MNNTHTVEAERYHTALTVLDRARQVNTSDIKNAQDAMIELRIEWEDLQACLKNRKVDGFETAVDHMMSLASIALAMAATLQARIKHMRDIQLGDVSDKEVVTPPSKEKKTKPLAKK
jgi:putative component of toxin-antitoxin plasmid stabilization module